MTTKILKLFCEREDPSKKLSNQESICDLKDQEDTPLRKEDTLQNLAFFKRSLVLEQELHIV